MRGDRCDVAALRAKQIAKAAAQAGLKVEKDKKDDSLKGVAARLKIVEGIVLDGK